MSAEIRFYKGKYKLKVVAKEQRVLTVEALEPFVAVLKGKKVSIRVGERRTMLSALLFKQESLPPPVKEHTYELKMEKKLKHIIEEEEKKGSGKT